MSNDLHINIADARAYGAAFGVLAANARAAADAFQNAFDMAIHQLAGRPAARPTIVVLCGSTRFSHAFREANLRETLAGRIVLSIGCDMRSDAHLFADLDNNAVTRIKKDLDELHKRKIDLADEVLVLNVGGYVGDSTRSEIDYAITHGKTIRWLEPGQPDTPETLAERLGEHAPPSCGAVSADPWTHDAPCGRAKGHGGSHRSGFTVWSEPERPFVACKAPSPIGPGWFCGHKLGHQGDCWYLPADQLPASADDEGDQPAYACANCGPITPADIHLLLNSSPHGDERCLRCGGGDLTIPGLPNPDNGPAGDNTPAETPTHRPGHPFSRIQY